MAIVEVAVSLAIVGATGRTAFESRCFGRLLLVAFVMYSAVFVLIMSLSRVAPDLTSLYTTVGLAVMVSLEEASRLIAFHWLARNPADAPEPYPFFIRAGYGAAYGVVEFISKWAMLWIGWIRAEDICPGIVGTCDSSITRNVIFLFPILLHIAVSAGCYTFGISRWKGIFSFAFAVFVHWQYNNTVVRLDDPHSALSFVIIIALIAIYAPARCYRQRDTWDSGSTEDTIDRVEP